MCTIRTKEKLKTLIFFTILLSFYSVNAQNLEVIVLGIAQDAGYPQANCQEQCCVAVHSGKAEAKRVASLGIVDLENEQTWIIDCTPDFKSQLKLLSDFSGYEGKLPDGIFLTHAHIGHYTGLVELGKEVIDADAVPVYAMPRMKSFVEKNGPWGQLVKHKNIKLYKLQHEKKVKLSNNLSITPILVPHRDEYSETVGFLIESTTESMLYIPDIDKWEKWDRDIVTMIKSVDYAILDGSFYKEGEIKGRDMCDIPHPFVQESLEKFSVLNALEKSRVHFTHLNHTNPLLDNKSQAYRSVFLNGFNVASEGLSFYLN